MGFALVATLLGVRAHVQVSAPPPADLMPIVGTDGIHPGDIVHVALQVKLPDGLHTNANKPRDPTVIPIALTIEPPAGGSVEELVFPAAIDIKSLGSEQPLNVFTGTFVIGAALKVPPTAVPGDLAVTGRLRYQACDEKVCYAPRTLSVSWTIHVVPKGAKVTPAHAEIFGRIPFGRGEKPPVAPVPNPSSISNPQSVGTASLDDFTLLGTANGYLGSTDFLAFIHDAENGVTRKGMFEGRGPIAILLIVFLGGLALNLTPCVLPMIPINLAIIGAGAKAGSRTKGFLLGGTYGAAMALVYGVLGLVVILTAGTFGTINASPWFNVGIAVLFLVLALAMFDVVTIDFSRFSSRFNIDDAGRGSFVVAFAMGAVAALLAGACVAPVVVQVVLFSSDLYAKGTSAALALPFVLGIGMAIPWPIAGAGIAALPKPGAWMVRVKQALGVVILITAAYYGYEGYSLFANRWVDAAEVNASVQEQLKAGWHPFQEGLATARRDGKPILIDMWATWCKNCLTMDKTTLENADVNGALSGYVKIKYQAEDLDEPATKKMLDRFKSPGLPTYAILRPK